MDSPQGEYPMERAGMFILKKVKALIMDSPKGERKEQEILKPTMIVAFRNVI